MNTIAIVEEWDQSQDEVSIDWSDFPISEAVEFADERVGMRDDFQQPAGFRASAEGRRFGYFDGGLDLDDDPE